MKEKSTRIVIEFKNTLKQQYQDNNPNAAPNLLIIEISPGENVSLQLNSKNPLKNGEIEPMRINFTCEQADVGVPEAYERLIHDAVSGDATFFAHWREVELSWEWVQPILEAFEKTYYRFMNMSLVHMVQKRLMNCYKKVDLNGG